LETTIDLTNVQRTLGNGVSYFGQATADDLSDLSQIVTDGIQLSSSAEQIGDGGLIYVFFVLGVFLWLVTRHKIDNAIDKPKRKVVKQWWSASDVEKLKRSSESEASQLQSTAVHTRIRKSSVGNVR
jgi:hypothetical protein